jgi:hypothetical protein
MFTQSWGSAMLTRCAPVPARAGQLKRKDCKNVIGLLSTLTKNSADPSKQKVIALLRRWKQIDVNITEAANEAKDNVKYLFTLERFIEVRCGAASGPMHGLYPTWRAGRAGSQASYTLPRASYGYYCMQSHRRTRTRSYS